MVGCEGQGKSVVVVDFASYLFSPLGTVSGLTGGLTGSQGPIGNLPVAGSLLGGQGEVNG